MPQAPAQRIESRAKFCAAGPAVWLRCDYLKGYPGNGRLSSETLRCVVQEIVDSLRVTVPAGFFF